MIKKKIYMRLCKRCGNIFYTAYKRSECCFSCYKVNPYKTRYHSKALEILSVLDDNKDDNVMFYNTKTQTI